MEWGSVSMLRFSGALVLTSPRNCLSKVTCLPSKGQIVHCRKYFHLIKYTSTGSSFKVVQGYTGSITCFIFYIFRLNESYASNRERKTDREGEKTMHRKRKQNHKIRVKK